MPYIVKRPRFRADGVPTGKIDYLVSIAPIQWGGVERDACGFDTERNAMRGLTRLGYDHRQHAELRIAVEWRA